MPNQHTPSPRGPALAIRPSLPPLARGSSPSSSSSLLAAHQAEIIPPSSGRSTPARSADGRRSPPSSLPSKHRLQSSSVRRAPPPPAALPSPLRGMQPPLLSDAQRADDTFSTASFGPLNYSFGGTTTAMTTAVQTPTTTTTIQNPVLTRSSSYIVERTIDAPTHSSSSSPLQMPMPMRPHTQHSTQPSHPQHHHLPSRAAVITVPSIESVTSPVIVPTSFQRVASRSPPLTYHQHAGAAGGAVITTSDRASTSSPGSSWRGGDGEGVPLVTFPSPVQTNTNSSRGDVSLSSGAVVGGGGGRSVPINNNNNNSSGNAAATAASPSPSGTTATSAVAMSAQQQHDDQSPPQHQQPRLLDDFNRAAVGAEDVSPHRRRLELSMEEQQPQQSSSAQRSLRIVSLPSQVAPTTSSSFYLGRVATAPVSPLRDEMYRQRSLSSASSSTAAVVTNVSPNNRDPFVDWCVAVASSVEMQLGGRAGSNCSGNF